MKSQEKRFIPIDKPFTSLFSTPTNNQPKKYFASTWLKAIKYHRKKLRKQKRVKFIALYENASEVSLGGKKVRRLLPQTSQTLRKLLEEQAPINNFGKNLLVPRNTAAGKIDNDVILLLWQTHCKCNIIITNFYPYLIQQWWYFFQVFTNGNVVNAQT